MRVISRVYTLYIIHYIVHKQNYLLRIIVILFIDNTFYLLSTFLHIISNNIPKSFSSTDSFQLVLKGTLFETIQFLNFVRTLFPYSNINLRILKIQFFHECNKHKEEFISAVQLA